MNSPGCTLNGVGASVDDMLFGPARLADGRVRFRLWAPDLAQAGLAPALVIDGRADLPMYPLLAGGIGDGWFHADVDCEDGSRYRFRIPARRGIDALLVPDPASRAQAGDVHDPSIVRTQAPGGPGAPGDGGWRGRPWHEAVIYELHVGACGGFAGVIERLPAIAELGFTAIELMPIGDFPGPRNWGYDVALPYAPDAAYGTPDQLRELVGAAHRLDLMVLLDVVYNHFGPDGNYLHTYASAFFREDQQTPWGAAIDFRQPMVRRFFADNAVYWLQAFQLDGLRFDAVHQIGDPLWVVETAARIRGVFGAGPAASRHVHLVLENEHNTASILGGDIDAQWNDDVHHALHVMLTGEEDGYYRDFAHQPARLLARGLAEGFIYQGQGSQLRDGRPRGEPSASLPPTCFVNCLQNHDQIGNRALGERLTRLTQPAPLRAAVELLLLAPQIPMVFMGEESGSRAPFLYFTSHHGELAELVRDGRRKEFAQFPAFCDPRARAAIPDPNDPATFEASAIDAGYDEAQSGHGWQALYRELLSLRWLSLFDRLPGTVSLGARAIGPKAVDACWRLGDGSVLLIVCNLDAAPASYAPPPGIELRTFRRLYPSQPAAAGQLDGGTLPGCTTIAMLQTPPAGSSDDSREASGESASGSPPP